MKEISADYQKMLVLQGFDSTKQAYVMAYEEVTIGFVTRKFSGQQFSSYVTQIIGSLLTYGIIVGLFRHWPVGDPFSANK